ncbi:O-Glycosyl hydrolase family 30 [Dictyocaulus viviparus]|uniref:Glucosylceramidase n=1 Tax=Dictyocaulus viviparus TaxID=29172 RepID=A0A0D8XDB2_DICVI|nr:O-Glycosyl hydrolase family 30 [Dictyocaulus viviparus]
MLSKVFSYKLLVPVHFQPVTEIPSGKGILYISSIDGKRFEKSVIPISTKAISGDVNIVVDVRKMFQSIVGFGGAFTDSVGINLNSLSEQTRRNLLEAYFSENGIQYNLGRVPIASTDFSTREYSYADKVDDFEMKSFSLAEDDYKYKGSGSLKEEVNGRYYRSYAVYLMKLVVYLCLLKKEVISTYFTTAFIYVDSPNLKSLLEFSKRLFFNFLRFFEEYAKNGVLYWGMTLQNEPFTGVLPFYKWQTTLFTAQTQRDFVKVTIGPLFKGNNFTAHLKIMALDDSRIFLPGWADTIYGDPDAAKYVDGIGVHWYFNNFMPAKILTVTHNRYPEKFILATEACTGSLFVHGPILGDWYRAEEYAEDIIMNLNNYVVGWTDWNMCLNEQGGPTWVNNFVDSPIIVNATADEFYKQPMFYAMGHFSKFIKSGAVRIDTKVVGSQKILATSVVYQGRRTVVLINKKSTPTSVSVNDALTKQYLHFTVAPHSIVTLLWDKQ